MSFHYDIEAYNTQSAEQVLPIVFSFMNNTPSSVLDVGCGNGTWLKVCEQMGIKNFLGIDGDHIQKEDLLISSENFRAYDLQKPFNLGVQYDLVISLEVAEHLPESSADIFIESLTKHGQVILFSAAIPKQGGFMHINEQYPSYWQRKFAQYDFFFYDLLRPAIWNNNQVQVWYKQNMFLVAHKSNVIAQKYTICNFIDLIHPHLYEQKARQAERANQMEQGELGIKIAFNSLRRAIVKSLWKK